MILFDHVGGDLFSKITFRNFGLSDAAEAFVFLSGISCGIFYPRVLTRRGWTAMLVAIGTRAFYIYVFYLLTCAVTISLLAAAPAFAHFDPNSQPLILLRAAPVSSMMSSVFLTSPPDLPAILLLYLVLTLIVIPLFMACAQLNAAFALAISATLWALAQFYPELLPHLSHFSVPAWQFIFAIGMFIGLSYYCEDAPRALPKVKYLVWAAWTIVLVGFIYQRLWHASLRFDMGSEWFPSTASAQDMKENLSAFRLVHFLSVALLVATYVSDRNPIFRSAPAVALIKTGRNSLEIFCMTAVISVLLNILVAIYHPNSLAKLYLDCCAILVVLLTATALTKFRQDRGHLAASSQALAQSGRQRRGDGVSSHSAETRERS